MATISKPDINRQDWHCAIITKLEWQVQVWALYSAYFCELIVGFFLSECHIFGLKIFRRTLIIINNMLNFVISMTITCQSTQVGWSWFTLTAVFMEAWTELHKTWNACMVFCKVWRRFRVSVKLSQIITSSHLKSVSVIIYTLHYSIVPNVHSPQLLYIQCPLWLLAPLVCGGAHRCCGFVLPK